MFEPAYQQDVNRLVAQMCASAKDATNLIGYYWTDTPRWDIDAARRLTNDDWVSAIRRLPSGSRGKQRYVTFLQDTYAYRADQFKIVYGVDLHRRDIMIARDFSDLSLTHQAVRRDDQALLRTIAHEYYRAAGEATRREDPAHLILGDRYLAHDHPPEVLEEALPWIDVLSVQPIQIHFERELFDRLHQISGKPILICDHQSSFPTVAYPATLWPQCASESQAANAYEEYLLQAFERPYMIGYHRCQYIDRELPQGILKQGLLRQDDTPYEILVDRVRRTNRKIVSRMSKLLT